MSQHALNDAIASMADDSPLLEGCRYILSTPGKWFRGSLVADAAKYGDRPSAPLVESCADAVELFHAASLAHDDVVDDGQMRRGKAAIGADAGNLAASLVGGWLFARASELIAAVGDEAGRRFADTAATVCEGEMMELADLHDVDRGQERYLDVIQRKTASLIAFSAWLGASAGGATPQVAERLYAYGNAVGMAFQISDDVMDLVADPARTGKTPGSDLRQGVYTLPVIRALERQPLLREALRRGPQEEDLPGLVEQVRAAGGIEQALAEGDAWIERARSALPSLEPRPAQEARLISLAGTVVGRVAEVASV